MRRNRATGFTLIELMIVVAVIAILAAIAIPSYLEQSAKGRRSEAMSVVGELQLRQERWRAENPSYATAAQLGAIPSSPYYTITPGLAPTASTYSITATPTGRQQGDRCGNLTATNTSKPDWSGDADCDN